MWHFKHTICYSRSKAWTDLIKDSLTAIVVFARRVCALCGIVKNWAWNWFTAEYEIDSQLSFYPRRSHTKPLSATISQRTIKLATIRKYLTSKASHPLYALWDGMADRASHSLPVANCRRIKARRSQEAYQRVIQCLQHFHDCTKPAICRHSFPPML